MARDMTFPLEILKELGTVLDKCHLSEIEYQKGDVRLRLVRSELKSVERPAVAATVPCEEANQQPSPPITKGAVIKSPMVGVVYLAPEPGGKPFVQKGDVVKEGQTLLIIEAMKVLNPVLAKKSGVIQEILVQNAQPVEFDEPLFTLEVA